MVRRGWPPACLMAMRPDEFTFWLETAVAAVRDENEAMKRAGGGGLKGGGR